MQKQRYILNIKILLFIKWTELINVLKKDVVIGLGEIGKPIMQILEKSIQTEGYDINPQLYSNKKSKKDHEIEFLHICIPYNQKFNTDILQYAKKYAPKAIIIHSTVKPNTTKTLQKKLKIPIIYSAIRGVHKRMLQDLRRYTKFYSVYNWAPNSKWASKTFEIRMKKAGIKTKKMSNPMTLELAKIIVDTSYYGWLINYAQISNLLAKKYGVNYDEMWSFADEIHKFLGNRPKMFPGFIGGHCVIPNLDLINEETLEIIKEINSDYAKILKKKY